MIPIAKLSHHTFLAYAPSLSDDPVGTRCILANNLPTICQQVTTGAKFRTVPCTLTGAELSADPVRPSSAAALKSTLCSPADAQLDIMTA